MPDNTLFLAELLSELSVLAAFKGTRNRLLLYRARK